MMWLSAFPFGPAPLQAGCLARESLRGGTTGGAVARFEWRTIHPYATKVEQKFHATSTCVVVAEWTVFQGLPSPCCDWPGKKERKKSKKGREGELRSQIETRAIRIENSRADSSGGRVVSDKRLPRSELLAVSGSLSGLQVKPLTICRARQSSDGSLEVLRY